MTLTALEMIRGDEKVWTFAVTVEGTGAAQDITGATVWFTAKRDYSDADPGVFQKKTGGSGIAIDAGTGGTGTIMTAAADTSSLAAARTSLVWDLQVKLSGGQPKTVARGTLTVLPDVTTSTT